MARKGQVFQKFPLETKQRLSKCIWKRLDWLIRSLENMGSRHKPSTHGEESIKETVAWISSNVVESKKKI